MKIVCFGDSNTYGFDPRSYFGDRYSAGNRWVDILADRLHCMVINAGENGREIPRRQWELADFEQMIATEKTVDLLIVMLGTNDLLQGNSVSDVVMRMEKFLRSIDLRRDGILLIAPPILQLGEWVYSSALVDASKALNESYRALAERLGVRFVDSGEWNLPLAFDGVHLTQEGHRALVDHLICYLREGGMVLK